MLKKTVRGAVVYHPKDLTLEEEELLQSLRDDELRYFLFLCDAYVLPLGG